MSDSVGCVNLFREDAVSWGCPFGKQCISVWMSPWCRGKTWEPKIPGLSPNAGTDNAPMFPGQVAQRPEPLPRPTMEVAELATNSVVATNEQQWQWRQSQQLAFVKHLPQTLPQLPGVGIIISLRAADTEGQRSDELKATGEREAEPAGWLEGPHAGPGRGWHPDSTGVAWLFCFQDAEDTAWGVLSLAVSSSCSFPANTDTVVQRTEALWVGALGRRPSCGCIATSCVLTSFVYLGWSFRKSMPQISNQ